MDPLSQILAGFEAAWWLLWSVPAVPMARDPADQAWQLVIGLIAASVVLSLIITG